eukprot:jgi/Hompol1/1397/HPOL_003050-RA
MTPFLLFPQLSFTKTTNLSMRIIGLTGGIATGKSTVSKMISAHNVPIVDADQIARDVVKPGQLAYDAICDTFGPSVTDENGDIYRPALGAIIFANADQRRKLNAITHPYIRMEMLRQVIACFLMRQRLCILDTPLLFETGLHRWVHSTVVVYCPDTIQCERLIARDGLSPLQAQLRIDSQMPIDRKRSLADHIVDNSDALESTRIQVDQLVKKLMPSLFIMNLVWMALFLPALCLYAMLFAIWAGDFFAKRGFERGKRRPGTASSVSAASDIPAAPASVSIDSAKPKLSRDAQGHGQLQTPDVAPAAGPAQFASQDQDEILADR